MKHRDSGVYDTRNCGKVIACYLVAIKRRQVKHRRPKVYSFYPKCL